MVSQCVTQLISEAEIYQLVKLPDISTLTLHMEYT